MGPAKTRMMRDRPRSYVFTYITTIGIVGTALLVPGIGTVGVVAAESVHSITPVATEQSRCPRTDKRLPGSQDPAARRVLVPAGPRGLLLCRYHGLDPDLTRAGMLARSRQLDRPLTVKRLARKFNALKSFAPCTNPAGCTTSCPDTDGTKVIVFFRYRRRADVPVVVEIGGCGNVSNGQLNRTSIYEPGPKLLASLLTLTHCRRSGPRCA
jgi:hypothetical protein